MLNISRGRSSSVPQNRFLRRLILHFDLLQDETATMNQATTILFLLVNLYIQIVPTNNTVDSSLNMLLGSAKMVPTIFSAGLFVSIILLLILLVSLIFENKYLDRNCTLDPPKHLKSVWYKFYKHLFRFHFLLLEPILSGYTLSLILPKSAFDVYPLRFQVFAIVGGTLGLLLSIPYFCLVESILPSSSWTSATNKYNIALTTIGLRLCIFLDYVYTSATDMALIGILMVIRISPSIIATYINLFATHFFNKHARVLFVGYQVSNIIYSIIFFVMGNDSTSLTLIPACFFIALGLRAVYNMDLMSRANLQHLSANKLSDILTLASHITDSQKENVVSASTEALRFQAVMAHLTSGRKELYEEYCETFASTDEKAHDNERNTSLFMVYLFERCWQSSGQKDFRTLVYETLFALTMRLNLFHISTMLARLHSLDLNVVEQSTLRALIRRIELSAKEIYLDKLSLIPVREQFYAPKSVAETNEAIANKLKLNNIEDDSRDYGDQAKTHVTAKVIRSSDLLHFDIYSSMQTIEQYEKLVNRMQDVIFTILKFYDKLKNRVVDVANAHETMKRIKILKEKVNKAFRTLDKSSGDQNIFHLLPYALFLETINNDRQASQKVLKAYEHRSQLLERSMNMSRGRTSSSKFSLDQMLCISVDCTRNSLGRMNYISSNSEEVFGLHPKHFEGRNIHTLMSDDFQTIHDEFLDKFVKDQDKPYLGVSRERHVRVHDNVYTKCDVLVKLSPVLNPTSLSFMCLLKKRVNDEEFIVINHQGVIIGRSQALDWADSILKSSYTAMTSTIPEETLDRIKNLITKNNALVARINSTISLGTPSAFRNRRSNMSNSHLHVQFDRKMLADETQLSCAKARPVFFCLEGRKRVFTDIILRISFEHIKRKPLDTAHLGKNNTKHSYDGNLHHHILERIEPDTNIAGFSSKIGKMANSNLKFGKHILHPDHNVTSGSLLIPSFRRTASGLSVTPKSNATSFGDLVRVSTRKDSVQVLLPQIKEGKIGFEEQLPLVMQAQTHMAKELQNLPLQEIEAMSSRNSSKDSGSMYTLRIKAKVLATIKQQRRYMVWKELLSLVLIQVLIWSASVYTEELQSENFGGKLRQMIDLRAGFGKMLMMQAAAFDAGILLVEKMLVLRGRIPGDKYKIILPSLKDSPADEILIAIHDMQKWTQLLTEHIYSFDFEYSQKYLTQKYTYTYFYYGEDIEVNQTMTKSIDLLDHARECMINVDRWNAGLNKTGRNFRFNDLIVGQYYELMSTAWIAVNVNTTLLILDTDTSNYQRVISNVMNLTLGTVLVGCFFAVTIVVIFWILRRKTWRLYSLLECLLPFEMQLMRDRLAHVQNALYKHKLSESKVKPQVKSIIRHYDYSYHQYWLKNRSSRTFLKTSLDQGSWFGTGWLATVLFTIIVIYQAVEYFTINRLGSKLDRLLVMQKHQRTLMTTTSLMSAINFNAYYIASKAANFGARGLPSFEQFSDDLDAYGTSFDQLIGQLDHFMAEIQSDKEDTLNFMSLIQEKPCQYFDYAQQGLPLSECESLADHTFSKSVMEAYRWMRLEMPSIINQLKLLNTSAIPIDYLTSKQFLTFEYSRQYFNVNFVYSFTNRFFDLLKLYHQAMFVQPLKATMLTLMLLTGLVSFLIVCIAIKIVMLNIEYGLQSFLLVPPESYYHNPHIAAKLLTITQ